MAVARTTAGGGWDGVKIGLIVFVVLTLLSLTAAVILYTYQTDLQTAAADAARSVSQANASLNKSRQDLQDVGQLVLGQTSDDTERMKQGIASLLQTMADDEQLKAAKFSPDMSVSLALQGLYKLYTSTLESLNKTTAERDELNQKLKDLDENAAARAAEFKAKAEELEKKYQELEQQSGANQQAWNQQVDELKKSLESGSAAATEQLAGERQMRQQLEQQLAEKDTRLKEMLDKLAKFQPTREAFSLTEMADGKIVRAVAGENIVYVSLGRNHRVQAGMPFSVYSPIRGPGPDLKEKATIEITVVFDTTSEARVVSGTPGDPILEGDLIANLVYDKSRQFNFVVAGDFDLDFDGRIEDPAGQSVITLIEKWGGKVASTVDTSIDFVVLGNPPPAPDKPAENADDDAAKQRAAEQAEVYQTFQAVKEEAKALSIPILTRTQFLHFIGSNVPSKVPDDQPAL